MATMPVTCPETAHLEEIEYEDSPLGILITSCTRLAPGVTCERTCAARMDRRRRATAVDPSDAEPYDDTHPLALRV